MQQFTVKTPDLTQMVYRWPAPGKPAVILLHGLTGCGLLWREVAESLSDAFDVLAPDLRGHGRTDKPANDYSSEAFAADILALMGQVGLERAALVGHSAGARVAWYVAFKQPDRVSKLVVEDQFPDARTDGVAYWQKQVGHWPRHFATRDEGVAFLRQQGRNLSWWEPSLVEAEGGGFTWGFTQEALAAISRQSSNRDDWPLAVRVECPVLVVRGADSNHLLPETARHMEAEIPDCRLVTIAGAGHWVHGQKPRKYIAAVREFLSQT